MKKQIFTAVASLAVVAAMSVSALAVDAGSSNGSDTTTVKADGSVEFVSSKVEGLVIEAAAGVFKEGVELDVDVEPVTAEEVAEVESAVTNALATGKIKTSSGATANIVMKSVEAVVDIKAMLDGAAVQPDGSVAITIAKSAGQTSNQVIYLGDDGNVEVLPTSVTATTLTFTTKHFSDFYVVTVDESTVVTDDGANNQAPGTGDTNGSNSGDDKNAATGVVIAVIPAIAAAAAIVVSKKRK